MSSLAQLQVWIVLGLSVVALGVELYALVDCLRRRSDAIVAAGVYLADVKPALDQVMGRGQGNQGPYGPW